MKKILIAVALAHIATCFADNVPLYGTADNPEINGVVVDIHKPHIETNPGYGTVAPAPVATTVSTETVSSSEVNGMSSGIHKQKKVNNMLADSWAHDSSVEKMLKQAASDGKLNYVLDQAKKANVPASVAIVPMVESNYNKKAVSPKGAGGAWQLMPGTANDYGLSYKDRFDFESSTQVAVQILNDLYKEFGNWALAFAAYNCGERCVTTALRKNPNAKDIDELAVPKETKDYVHKIIQLNKLIAGLDKSQQPITK